MDLFYLPKIESNSSSIIFPKEEAKHISRVLRKKTGDQLRATNGAGLELTLELSKVENHACHAQVISKTKHTPLPYSLHLAVAPTKNINRFEWVIEKATEIGVHTITPILCDHSERKIVKIERLSKIMIAALKQSQQFFLPTLNPMETFQSFLSKHTNGLIAHCHPSDKTSLLSIAKKQGDHLILIGPEGDFSLEEIQAAEANGYLSIQLGNQRLRTETAAIVACHTIALNAQ